MAKTSTYIMKDLKEMVKTLEMLETKVVKASTSSATSDYLKACETLEHGIEEMTLSLLNQAHQHSKESYSF